MATAALDGTKLLVLMAAGAIFAAAGLWLMFRPKPEGGAAKLELLGMKFESSSAGLLVFLIGAGFLATPLIVSEKLPSNAPAPTASVPAKPEAAAVAPAGDVPRRVRAAGKEREPNEDYDAANQIAVGDSVSGRVDDKSEDWFVMPIDTSAATVFVKIRNVDDPGGWGNYCNVHMYSEAESEIAEPVAFPANKTAKSFEIQASGFTTLFLRIEGCGSGIAYELFTGYSPFQ